MLSITPQQTQEETTKHKPTETELKTTPVAVVSGASGVTGRGIIKQLQDRGFEVITIGRGHQEIVQSKHIKCNLLDRPEAMTKLSAIERCTHIFHCAYIEKADQYELSEVNKALLVNLIESVEKGSGSTLKHVCCMHGAKWYGLHLGSMDSPAKENGFKTMVPMFYYAQHDYLDARVSSQNCSWTYVTPAPNPVIGYSPESPMNLLVAIAVYATICSHLDVPFLWPGNPDFFHKLQDVCDVNVLGKAMIWSTAEPACRNQLINVSNGDVFRWSHMWRHIADYFHLTVPAEPKQPFKLTEMMTTPDKKEIWRAIVEEYGLQSADYDRLVQWPFADAVFGQKTDSFLDVTKARKLGFDEMKVDSFEMFTAKFDELRALKIIP